MKQATKDGNSESVLWSTNKMKSATKGGDHDSESESANKIKQITKDGDHLSESGSANKMKPSTKDSDNKKESESEKQGVRYLADGTGSEAGSGSGSGSGIGSGNGTGTGNGTGSGSVSKSNPKTDENLGSGSASKFVGDSEDPKHPGDDDSDASGSGAGSGPGPKAWGSGTGSGAADAGNNPKMPAEPPKTLITAGGSLTRKERVTLLAGPFGAKLWRSCSKMASSDITFPINCVHIVFKQLGYIMGEIQGPEAVGKDGKVDVGTGNEINMKVPKNGRIHQVIDTTIVDSDKTKPNTTINTGNDAGKSDEESYDDSKGQPSSPPFGDEDSPENNDNSKD